MMRTNSLHTKTARAASLIRKTPRMLPRVLGVVCLYCMLCFGMLLAAGCAGASDQERAMAAAVPYTEVCLHNYELARYYAVAGRYELAKEHYLLALASAENPRLRGILASELDGVEKMIYTTR